jgi:hypothetical protein
MVVDLAGRVIRIIAAVAQDQRLCVSCAFAPTVRFLNFKK